MAQLYPELSKVCTQFLRLSLGIPFETWTVPPLSDWLPKCHCGTLLDDSGYHLLTCKSGGDPIWTHDAITTVWPDCLRDLHIYHRREPRHRYSNSDNRPDITVYDPETGINIDLDIAMAHPWSSDIFPKSAEEDDAAAKRKEERKMNKYRKVRLPGGSMVKVTPLVLEHFGKWREEDKKFLYKFSKHSLGEIGRPNAPEFIDYWRQKFSVQLQKCNAKVLLKEFSTLQ